MSADMIGELRRRAGGLGLEEVLRAFPGILIT